MTILTKNTDQLRRVVAEHIAADAVVQGNYWNREQQRGCFIGCLAHSNDPSVPERTYGLPVMVQRIAEGIFEALPAEDARAFFAALPESVACDGKDLTRVRWQFLAAELRSLPPQPPEIQAVVDPVITGLDLLAEGQNWPEAAAARAADDAARAADGVVAAAARAAARAAAWAVADDAARAAVRAADGVVAAAARAADDAARAAARAAGAAVDDAARAAVRVREAAGLAARRRQRDLLLQLISSAPVA
jgi:hypothetical protein